MGFQNEKDHPEVAPSQFEMNYGYAEVVAAADQMQLYKLICRQVATNMGLTAMLPAQAGRPASTAAACTPTFPSARTARTCSGSEGRGKARQAGMGLHRPHPDPRPRHLPAAQLRA